MLVIRLLSSYIYHSHKILKDFPLLVSELVEDDFERNYITEVRECLLRKICSLTGNINQKVGYNQC